MATRVGPTGPEDARIMIVGEAPGAQEEIQGKPFVGPAGGILREVALKAGVNPDQCWLTNVSKYRPPNNVLEAWVPKDGLPHENVLNGLEELREEIQQVKPNVIVACGNWPLRFLTGKYGITNWRGSILEGVGPASGRKVVASYHPSFILRGMAREKPIMRLDFQRVRDQSRFPEIRRPVKDLILDPAPDRWAEARERLLAGPVIDFDIEYIGSRLLCVGMTTGPDWAVCKVIHNKGDTQECKDILESGIPLCAQNGMFDCSILEWHYGFDIMRHLAYDTMVAQYVLNIEYPKGLDFLTSIYTEQPYYKDMVDWDLIKKGKQSIDDVWEYNAIDTWVTSDVRHQQTQELASNPKYQEAFDFDMAKLYPLWDIARRGVRIDVAYRNKLLEEANDKEQMLQLTVDAINQGPLNVKSITQVPKLLFDTLGVPARGKTPTGIRKTDDVTLAAVRIKCMDNPKQLFAIDAIRDLRSVRDEKSKTLEVEFDDDGRMRCMYDCTKTDTRRLSSRKFYPTGRGRNLQNEDRSSRIRRMYIPDEGYEFGYADLKAAEFLVVAELTQDPEMLRLADMTVKGTGDVHKLTASYVFEKDVSEITYEERFLGKKTRHSANYIVGWKELMDRINAEANVTGVTVDAKTVKRILDRYKAMHPGLVAWWRDVEAQVRATRVLRNCFGFIREFHDSIDGALPAAVAFNPQSTIGDTLNYGLLAAYRNQDLREAGFQMLLQVHDAIGFQYPIGARNAVLPILRKAMDVPVPIDRWGRELHIPVEIKVGTSWGEDDLKVWEEDLTDAKAAA